MTTPSPRPPAPDTPELEKIHINRDDSRTIGEFLEWADENGYHFTRTVRGDRPGWYEGTTESCEWQAPARTEEALAAYFGIDLKKAEEERRALHAYIARVADIAEQEPTP